MSDSIRTIPVRVQPPYDVTIGDGLLGRCGDYLAALLGQRKMAVLTDDTVAPLYLETVTAALEGKGYVFAEAAIEMVPQNYIKLTDEEDVKNMTKLIDLLEENDDVQNVWHNWEQD